MPEYYVGLLLFAHVGGGWLFYLTAPLVNVVSHLEFFLILGNMHMGPVLVPLAFHCVFKFDRSLLGGLNDFLSYGFATVYQGGLSG